MREARLESPLRPNCETASSNKVNWHGDIMLFDGKTSRPHLLTTSHRTYGGGEHPEVGWDRKGERVIFSSHKLGGVTICVATIPTAWQKELTEVRIGLEAK